MCTWNPIPCRLYDYLWVAEDGMKMQGYNGSQLWDTAFSCQAIVETGLEGEFTECLTKISHYLESTQVVEEGTHAHAKQARATHSPLTYSCH